MIAVPLTGDLLKQRASITKFLHDLLLVWDWDISRGEQHDEDYEYFMSSRGVPKCLVIACDCLGALDKAVRSWNFGLLLNRLERYGEAAKHFRSAVELCRTGASLRTMEEAYPGHSGWREADTETLKVLDDLVIEDKGALLVENCIKYGRTLLSWAAQEGCEAVVCRLLEAGAAIEVEDDNGRTALSWAAGSGHEAIIQLLLATGKVNADSGNTRGRTPLSFAAAKGHDAVVQLLLAIGEVNTNSQYANGRTPLSFAAMNGHEAIVRLLLATGKVNADSQDINGRTPLSFAIVNGHEAIVQLLEEGEG